MPLGALVSVSLGMRALLAVQINFQADGQHSAGVEGKMRLNALFAADAALQLLETIGKERNL